MNWERWLCAVRGGLDDWPPPLVEIVVDYGCGEKEFVLPMLDLYVVHPQPVWRRRLVSHYAIDADFLIRYICAKLSTQDIDGPNHILYELLEIPLKNCASAEVVHSIVRNMLRNLHGSNSFYWLITVERIKVLIGWARKFPIVRREMLDSPCTLWQPDDFVGYLQHPPPRIRFHDMSSFLVTACEWCRPEAENELSKSTSTPLSEYFKVKEIQKLCRQIRQI